MLTTMVEFQRLTNLTGQVYTIFTNDKKLYRTVVNVTWTYPAQFQNVIPRIGGMHTLMNFAGAVGVLMSDTGLETILQATFGGVSTILSGKKFPQNIRAPRHLTEELLREVIFKIESFDGWNTRQKPVAQQTLGGEPHQVGDDHDDGRQADREADWPLHLWSVKEMLP